MKALSKIAAGVSPSATLAVSALAKKMKAEGKDVIGFGAGEPDFATPDRISYAGVRAICDGKTRYTPAAGMIELRQAICDRAKADYGLEYEATQAVVASGAKHMVYIALAALVDPGDEVIVPAPYWVSYYEMVRLFGGVPVVVNVSEEQGFQLTPEQLEQAITDKTKAIILNNPNNPTGVIYSAEMLKKLGALLEEKGKEFGTVIYVIADEPYRELAYDGAEVPWLPDCCKNTIVGYSWSKSLSLPGERIGYLVIPSDIVDAQLIIDAAVVANRMLGFVNAPSLMQLAVARCLDASTDIAAYDANRKLLYNGLHELGYECEYPAGAFYLWVKTPVPEPEFVALAKKYNLLLVPGASFGCPGYVRLAYCVSGDMIKRSMAAFAKLAADCGLKK